MTAPAWTYTAHEHAMFHAFGIKPHMAGGPENAVPCRACSGLGGDSYGSVSGEDRSCSVCCNTGIDEWLYLIRRPIAGASIVVNRATPCPNCHGGEFWECPRCYGCGFDRAAVSS